MNKMNKIISASTLIFLLYCAVPLNSAENNRDAIPVYNVSGEITVPPGKTAAAVIAVEIPDGSYIYSNPKGPGIGKAAEVTIEKNRIIGQWEARFPEGEKYQAKGDPDHVYIYKKIVRLPFTFTVNKYAAAGNYTVKVKVSLLACSSESCIPVERTVDFAVKVTRGVQGDNPYEMNRLGEFLSLRKTVNTGLQQPDKDLIRDDGNNGIGKTGIPGDIIFTPGYPDGEITGILKAVFFGLIAGFILNFMPCVLPVVSLKIMSFVMNSGEKKRVVVTQGFLFSAGIIVSFLALASLAAFSGYKWGELFQQRFFIILMASFIFSMALSLFGVFTFNVPVFAAKAVSKTHGIYTDAFIKGVVATLLATPCSGPFLGGTLAWALTRPPEIIFIIFLSIGFGMALPYMLLALYPSLLRLLPGPGEWMNHFEKVMGFLLMFTVVYLLGILDNYSKVRFVLFLLFLSIALWQFGTFGSLDKERRKRIVSFTVMIAIVATGYFLSFSCLNDREVFPGEKISFDTERILKNRGDGIISVVEFTADWCPNCSFVEKVALKNERVQKLFGENDIEFIVADLTRKNPEAEALLNRLGGKSIPFLAVFPPGEDFISPVCLRDIYSADDVVNAVGIAEKSILKKKGVLYDSK